MHLVKTQEGSQFYRFHDISEAANECLTYKTPMINGRKVDILQIAYIEDVKYNVLVEFVYKMDEE